MPTSNEPTRPAPILTPDNAFFWEACERGELVAQRCGACGRLAHPPRPMCPHCHSLAREIVQLSGRGAYHLKNSRYIGKHINSLIIVKT